MLSQTLWHLGDLEPAADALKRCLALLPDDVEYKPFGMATFPAIAAHAGIVMIHAKTISLTTLQRITASQLVETASRLHHRAQACACSTACG